jgi:hypothetical protein
MAITKEIGVSKAVIDCLNSIGFSRTTLALNDDNFEHKICNYSDQRVAPQGVVSVEKRLAEGKKRYENSPKKAISLEHYDKLFRDLKELERQIFEHASIKPLDITNKIVQPYLEKLKVYQI